MNFSRSQKSLFLIFSLFILSHFTNFAQKRLEVGPIIGASFYQGDVLGQSVGEISRNLNWAGGIQAGYYFNNYLGIRIGIQRGKASGGDQFAENPAKRVRNLSFESPVTDAFARLEWDITGYNPRDFKNFTIYTHAGYGLIFFNPKAVYKGKTYKLQALGTEGQGLAKYPDRTPYKLITSAVSAGGGIKFALNEQWNVGAEFTVYRTFTDYLDDVAGNYVPYTDILAENGNFIAAALSSREGELLNSDQIILKTADSGRGNAKVYDYYYMGGVTLTYNFYDPFGGKGIRKFSKYKSTKDCFKF